MLTTQQLARTNYQPDMTQPQIPPAGITTKLNETAKDALTWNANGRPETPSDIRKYRQSAVHEPGKITKHFGVSDDPVPEGPFGAKSAASGGQNVLEAVKTYPDSEIGRWKQEQAEAIYASSQREPLGRGFVRGHNIPDGLGTTRPFGVEYDALGKEVARQARKIVFPTDQPVEDDPATHQQYLRSHADYMPGEQRRRDYDWQKAGIDPNSHRFGAVDKNVYRDGVRKAMQPALDQTLPPINKVLPLTHEEHKATAADQLGKSKRLGVAGNVPSDYTYGVPSLRRGPEPGVGDLLNGSYNQAEQQPDSNLGKSLREGFRNSTRPGDENRSFGVPSIRTDVALPKMRSVANAQNYGNEPGAGHLLSPPLAAELGISDEEFVRLRSKQEIRGIASDAGMALNDEQFEQVWELAKGADGNDDKDRACLDTFFRARHHILAQTLVVAPQF